jgi:hypothetical protein
LFESATRDSQAASLTTVSSKLHKFSSEETNNP